jgi:hypothetical protein
MGGCEEEGQKNQEDGREPPFGEVLSTEAEE